jgi:hypothetical protein
MKKGFIIVTFVLGVALVAMTLTKPKPHEVDITNKLL